MIDRQSDGYHRNHYVPIWYQQRFLGPALKEQKFHYLDLRPDFVTRGTRRIRRHDLLHWGPVRCFREDDLYTTRFGAFESTDIEKYFFGKQDNAAESALDYFANFEHENISSNAFHTMLPFMSVQKLRTPKGLAALAERIRSPNKNHLLIELQRLQQMYCALWTECIWSIADASDSNTKFIVSDHPVTVYNNACFPASQACAGFRDPDVWLTGTHTIYPLNLNRCLILTNLSWVRNCYTSPLRVRPNPSLFREAVFNFLHVQIGRKLSEREVIEINHVIKSRADRYIAASEKEWLYPERHVAKTRWDRLGNGYLFMPDPRAVSFGGEMFFGFEGGGSKAFDAYGHRTWQKGYDRSNTNDVECMHSTRFKANFRGDTVESDGVRVSSSIASSPKIPRRCTSTTSRARDITKRKWRPPSRARNTSDLAL
jgi:hypothetical protein